VGSQSIVPSASRIPTRSIRSAVVPRGRGEGGLCSITDISLTLSLSFALVATASAVGYTGEAFSFQRSRVSKLQIILWLFNLDC
jgi:hypothetical protein